MAKKILTQVSVQDFGKDHWSLLGYVETCAVDNKGVLDLRRMRVKNNTLQPNVGFGPVSEWKPEYGTRLAGYWKADKTTDLSKRLSDHDDLDCLEDLETAGFIKNTGTGMQPVIEITKLGKSVCSDLRFHKSSGGNFADFKVV